MKSFSGDEDARRPLQAPQDDPTSAIKTETSPLLFSKRFFIAIFLGTCYVTLTITRHNVNITVVEMTSEKNITHGNLTISQPPEFDWDSKTIALVISLVPYGSLLSFTNGFFVTKFGGSVWCAVSLMICGITTFLHPFFIYLNFYTFAVCRFITGIFDSFITASITEVFSRWTPKSERSRLISLSFNGAYIGLAITNPFCGYLAFEYGWPTVFYVTGTISSIISVIFFILVKNHPSQDNWISETERSYIVENTDKRSKKQMASTPYNKILTSSSIWALWIINFSSSWVVTMVTACLPLFVKDVTQRNIQDVGIISAIPNAVGILTSMAAGTLMDYWKNHTTIRTTTMHKIVVSVGFFGQAVLFLGLNFLTNFTAMMIAFVIIRIFLTSISFSSQLIAVSIAPNHTSTISGFNTFWFSLSTIMNRGAIGFLITDHTMDDWNRSFLLTSAILLLSAIIFSLYGSSNPQRWSVSPAHEVDSNIPLRDVKSQWKQKSIR